MEGCVHGKVARTSAARECDNATCWQCVRDYLITGRRSALCAHPRGHSFNRIFKSSLRAFLPDFLLMTWMIIARTTGWWIPTVHIKWQGKALLVLLPHRPTSITQLVAVADLSSCNNKCNEDDWTTGNRQLQQLWPSHYLVERLQGIRFL